MNIKLLIFALLLTVTSAFGQVSSELPHYTPEQLRNDIDTLVSNIEEIHINPYYKYPKDKFYADIKILKESITQPMSALDFYCFISPVIAKLEDGHTSIQQPIDIIQQSKQSIFPYKVELSEEKPYIIVLRPYKTISSELPRLAEIIDINGIDSKIIIDKFKQMSSGESEKFRLKRFEESFGLLLFEILKTKSPYKVSYITKESKEINSVTIQGLTIDSLINRMKSENQLIEKDYSLKIDKDLNTATIDFKSFNNISKFKEFIDSTFVIIKKENIDNLIIDIRQNGGGNSRIGDEFLRYICNEKFIQFASTKMKYSRLQKDYYSKNKYISLFGKNGVVKEYKESNSLKPIKLKKRFVGKTYLLTSSYTFSSASSFAAAFKNYNIGTIVGEETGGWLISYGDNIYEVLPNTRLSFTVSHKQFYLIGAQEGDYHGVIPDISVPADKAIDYTLEMIKNPKK